MQKRKLCWLRWTCSHIGSDIPWGCPGVAVASAIASERPLIVFDEPTSGLDLFHMRQVAEVVNRITEQGRTAVVVTHDPEFILRCCKFVIHMEHGKIQESYSLCEPEGRERLLRFFLNEMG